MTTFVRNVRLENLGKYERDLARNAKPMLERALRKTAEAGVRKLKARTEDVGAVASGKLKRGWRITKAARDISYTIENKQFYALFVERGRRRGARQPPRQAIELWVKKKLGLSGKEAKSAAFLIARAISRRGIKGRFIVLGSYRTIETAYRRNLDTELERYYKGRRA